MVSYWDVVFSPLLDNGRVVGVLDVVTDATERIEAHRELETALGELQRREERLGLVMHGTNDGIWDWDLATDAVYYSPRWKGMLGYEDHEIENDFNAWERLIHPDDRERAIALVKDIVAGRAQGRGLSLDPGAGRDGARPARAAGADGGIARGHFGEKGDRGSALSRDRFQ
jgi:PAS domain-containing protein